MARILRVTKRYRVNCNAKKRTNTFMRLPFCPARVASGLASSEGSVPLQEISALEERLRPGRLFEAGLASERGSWDSAFFSKTRERYAWETKKSTAFFYLGAGLA